MASGQSQASGQDYQRGKAGSRTKRKRRMEVPSAAREGAAREGGPALVDGYRVVPRDAASAACANLSNRSMNTCDCPLRILVASRR